MVADRANGASGQIKSYRDLMAWQRAMDFAVAVYRETESWPSAERFGLIQQLWRCCVSIPSNIAEGQGRHSDREFMRFLRIAHGSLQEAETQIMLARQLQYCSIDAETAMMTAAGDVGRLIQGLSRSLARSLATATDDR